MPQHAELSLQERKLLLQKEQLQRELCRHDYHAFISRLSSRFRGGFKDGWHIHEIARIAHQIRYALEHPEDTEVPRIYIVTMPPRHMKSENFARGIPLWLLGHDPRMEVIVGTCEGNLAKEHGDWIKNTATSEPLFKGIFPELEIRPDSKAKDRLITQAGGGVRSVGRGGGAVGRGADLFIIDDPYKNDKEADSEATQKEVWDWYINVADSRLSPTGVTVIMHTRWRTDDLIGRVLKMHRDAEADPDEEASLGNICHIDFPLIAVRDEYSSFTGKMLRRKGEALHPARFPLSWAKRKRAKMLKGGDSGARTWNAIYQQNPVVEQGNFFKKKFFQWYEPSQLPDDLYWYLTTDYAVTENEDNDPSALMPFGVDRHKNIYFSPTFFHGWERTSYTVPKTIELAKMFDVFKVLIEKGVILQSIEPQLRDEMDRKESWYSLEGVPLGRNDKKMRAKTIRDLIEQGRVFFPNTTRFRELVVPELLMFPNGEHDEFPDCLSLAGNSVATLDTPMGPKKETPPDEVRTGYTPSGIKLPDKKQKGGRYDLRRPERWGAA